MTNRQPHIRPAIRSDAEAIREIYNRQVLESTVTLDLVPRTLPEQQEWIKDRSGGLAALVATIDEVVVGFASLSFYRDRPGYRTSVENSVYVHHEYLRRGIGSVLLGELLVTAKNHGFHSVFARIAGPQPASVALHENHGFRLVGVEQEVGRKFNQWHDVALMQLLLNS